MSKCDICCEDSKNLSDHFALMCPNCRDKHKDTILLRRVGVLMTKVEQLQKNLSQDSYFSMKNRGDLKLIEILTTPEDCKTIYKFIKAETLTIRDLATAGDILISSHRRYN